MVTKLIGQANSHENVTFPLFALINYFSIVLNLQNSLLQILFMNDYWWEISLGKNFKLKPKSETMEQQGDFKGKIKQMLWIIAHELFQSLMQVWQP